MEADALATAGFVMGMERGGRFIEDTQHVEGMLVDSFGKRIGSKSWCRA